MPPFKKRRKCESVCIVEHNSTGVLYLRYQSDDVEASNARGRKPEKRHAGKRTVYESLGHKDIRRAITSANERNAKLDRLGEITQVVGRMAAGDVLDKAIWEFSKSKTLGHKRNMGMAANLFCKWLQKTFRKPIVYWDEITPSVLRAYVSDCHKRGLAARTIKLYLNPITLASRLMSELDPDAFRHLRVTHPALSLPKTEKLYLTRDELQRALSTAQTMPTDSAELGILLGGYCGLRMREVARLRFSDFNFKAATLDVRDSKNAWSERLIPIPPHVAKRVNEIRLARPEDQQDVLIANEAGEPGIAEENLSKPMMRVFKRVQKQCDEEKGKAETEEEQKAWDALKARFASICPRNMRTSFANLAVQARVPSMELQCYLGQRPDNILAQHYADYSGVDLLRERVVDAMFPKTKESTQKPAEQPQSNVQDMPQTSMQKAA